MTLAAIWKSCWFRPGPLFDLGFCRAVCVGTQLALLVADRSFLIEHSALPEWFYSPRLIVRLALWPFATSSGSPLFRPSSEAIAVIYCLTLLAGVFALLGFLTRISLPLFAFGNLFVCAFIWSFRDFHHQNAVIAVFLCVLVFSPAGAGLSLDDLRRRLRIAVQRREFQPVNILNGTSSFAQFPLLLGRHLMAYVYLNAAAFKIWTAGPDWLNGYTLQYYLWSNSFTWGSDIGVWLAQHHTLAVFLSWVTLIFEATFFLVLIFSSLVVLYIPLGLMLHVGMCLTRLACFFQYFALYVVFIPWSELAKKVGRSRHAEKLRILFDGECLLCIRSMTFVGYWDWFERLTYVDMTRAASEVPAALGQQVYPEPTEMVVVRPDGVIRKGFFAWREIILRLPALWPFLLVLWLPGMSKIGPFVYGRIAAARTRFQSCGGKSCSAGCSLG